MPVTVSKSGRTIAVLVSRDDGSLNVTVHRDDRTVHTFALPREAGPVIAGEVFKSESLGSKK